MSWVRSRAVNGSKRPSVMPAHKNSSQGSSGCVLRMKTSSSRSRGERVTPALPYSSQFASCCNDQRCSAAAASAAATPIAIKYLLRSVKSSAPTMKNAP